MPCCERDHDDDGVWRLRRKAAKLRREAGQ